MKRADPAGWTVRVIASCALTGSGRSLQLHAGGSPCAELWAAAAVFEATVVAIEPYEGEPIEYSSAAASPCESGSSDWVMSANGLASQPTSSSRATAAGTADTTSSPACGTSSRRTGEGLTTGLDGHLQRHAAGGGGLGAARLSRQSLAALAGRTRLRHRRRAAEPIRRRHGRTKVSPARASHSPGPRRARLRPAPTAST